MAALICAVLVGKLIERLVRRRRFARLASLEPEDREAEIQQLEPQQAALARLAFAVTFRPERLAQLPASRTFVLGQGSRSLNEYLFWTCLVVAGAIAVPLALGRFDDAGDAALGLALIVIMLLAAFGYRTSERDQGTQLTVDREGLTLQPAHGPQVRIGWLELASLHTVSFRAVGYQALVLCSKSGARILVDSQMPEFIEIAELVLAKVEAIHGAT
ncbi:MAG TPA: hypothetical protein VNL98_01335 [Gemmatimonadales bacterium]|nr:hypothetical protein [Gemmatimonadales bacterium]